MKTYEEIAESSSRKKPKDTLVIKAVLTSNIKVLKKVLEQGNDPNLPGIDGWRPIHYAAMRDDRLEMLKLLIELGVDVNVTTDPYGASLTSTPIYLARYFAGKESVKQLILAGARVESAFESPNDLFLYFENDLSWWKNAPDKYKTIQKTRSLFKR